MSKLYIKNDSFVLGAKYIYMDGSKKVEEGTVLLEDITDLIDSIRTQQGLDWVELSGIPVDPDLEDEAAEYCANNYCDFTVKYNY